VDLGSLQNIARVRLDWETAYSQSYRIQLSTDNSTWIDAYATTNGVGGINDLAVPGSARYVRLYSTQRATSWGNSLYEFEVYPALSPVLSITPAAPNVVVSWPVTTASWTLQATPALGATNQWSAVTNVPAVAGSQNTVTNGTTAGARFYRLRQTGM
jgi:hypothetical protein